MLQAAGQGCGEALHAARDSREAIRAVVHRVEASHHRQQHLGGADVAGGLIAADVLLAGLQGQAQGWLASRIPRHAHQAARDLAFVGLRSGKKGSVGTAKAQGHAKPLGTAHRDLHAELRDWGHQHLGQGIDSGDHEHIGGLGAGNHLGWIGAAATGAGQLQQQAKAVLAELHRSGISHHQLNAQRLGAGLQHRQGLGE